MVAFAANSDGSRWFVVHTQPHRELQAERNLTAQAFKAFLPVHWKTTRHARQFRTAKSAFFPRYLFVELDLERDRWRSVNGTFGVASMIMEGERPKPVPVGVVEGLIAQSAGAGVLHFDEVLQPGTTIRMTLGPLAGALGTLVRMTSSQRVEVLLNVMGGSVPFTVPKDNLAPAA